MDTNTVDLSDKALAVLAFAAYHQLESGQPVASIVQHDGAGHRADPDAIAELQARGLASADGERIAFTAEGERILAEVIAGMREKLRGR